LVNWLHVEAHFSHKNAAIFIMVTAIATIVKVVDGGRGLKNEEV
jgi:hypothetical protein